MHTPKRKLIDLKHKDDHELIADIQEYANKNHIGNFTQAVRRLCSIGLRLEGKRGEGDD